MTPLGIRGQPRSPSSSRRLQVNACISRPIRSSNSTAIARPSAARWCSAPDRRKRGIAALFTGSYTDDLIRTVHGWRFARRVVHVDFANEARLTLPRGESLTGIASQEDGLLYEAAIELGARFGLQYRLEHDKNHAFPERNSGRRCRTVAGSASRSRRNKGAAGLGMLQAVRRDRSRCCRRRWLDRSDSCSWALSFRAASMMRRRGARLKGAGRTCRNLASDGRILRDRADRAGRRQ